MVVNMNMCIAKKSQNVFHTEWRRCCIKKIAEEMDMVKFGIKAIYLFGSVESGNAGMGSDIDLIIQLAGYSKPEMSMIAWLNNWNIKLCDICEHYTSIRLPYILDIHFVNDLDFDNQTCYAAKVNSVREPIELLRKV